MRLSILHENEEFKEYDCKSFEFRSNNVTNWIKIIPKDGSNAIRLYKVRVIKTLDN